MGWSQNSWSRIFIYSCYARLISFEINPNDNWFQKKLVCHNTNIWIYTPPINALATALQAWQNVWLNLYISMVLFYINNFIIALVYQIKSLEKKNIQEV